MASMMLRASIDSTEFTLAQAAASFAGQTTPEWIAEAIRDKLAPFCSQLVDEVAEKMAAEDARRAGS